MTPTNKDKPGRCGEGKRGQSGVTFIGMVFIVAVLGLAGYVGLKLFPIYSESFRIDASLKGLAEDEEVGQMTKRGIIKALVRRLDINEVDRITERNWARYVTIDREQATIVLTIKYRAETALFGNLSLVADFEKRASLPR